MFTFDMLADFIGNLYISEKLCCFVMILQMKESITVSPYPK